MQERDGVLACEPGDEVLTGVQERLEGVVLPQQSPPDSGAMFNQ
ncbi:MAG: hypothetical protein ACREH3_05325 [Geminicoccales bacterium]